MKQVPIGASGTSNHLPKARSFSTTWKSTRRDQALRDSTPATGALDRRLHTLLACGTIDGGLQSFSARGALRRATTFLSAFRANNFNARAWRGCLSSRNFIAHPLASLRSTHEIWRA